MQQPVSRRRSTHSHLVHIAKKSAPTTASQPTSQQRKMSHCKTSRRTYNQPDATTRTREKTGSLVQLRPVTTTTESSVFWFGCSSSNSSRSSSSYLHAASHKRLRVPIHGIYVVLPTALRPAMPGLPANTPRRTNPADCATILR